ncbi:disulfide bond formation protein B [Sphingomonas changnyeongensis]|uniref:Disulfide bond formation protein B n=1 Tax=Sphingomonas changnyeongensis TaxID=2698679 RepID=A0A7Z2NTR1_9SPHN|nr:disulfide bond formation protein B [Sphingomonas changnyeongensis]QHL89678.1 disulfide bond formation protein B [Sphingomonas changnyeongensis]
MATITAPRLPIVTSLAQARLLAFAAPSALLGGALASEYLGGLFPCEMCYWQRWPHEVALVLALFAFVLPARLTRPLVLFAALAIAVSGAIGVFHAGVEYGWWEGVTSCAANAVSGSSEDLLKSILAAPIIRCDQPQWTLFGVSLAGFNALFSFAAAACVAALAIKGSGTR